MIRSLSEELGLFLSISFGVFLFVLFFEPFPLDHFDFKDRLLFVAGLGGIVFLFIFLVRIVYPWLVENNLQSDKEPALPSYMSGFVILAFSSVAFSFYLNYVGFVGISFYLVFKVVLLCLAPPVILGLYDKIRELNRQIEGLISEKKVIQKQIEKYEDENLNKSIDFISENNAENLSLLIGEVVFIKSADNYVEILYLEGDQFKKKLIRNTLKNIELQIKHYTNFIRCHRICIVNTHYVDKLVSNYNNHSLILKGYDEQIPVSRQYLLKVKEAI
jgi:hypothetical protein